MSERARERGSERASKQAMEENVRLAQRMLIFD